jgi:hypothetical protein
MTLRNELKLRSMQSYTDGVTWTSPSSPVGQDWQEMYTGLTPIPTEHAPSLRNPLRTKIPLATDGWHPGDSAEARRQAMQDLVAIHARLRRQIGKPEIAHTAQFPVYPRMTDWM